MKDYNGMKITPLFNLCDYNIKIKDVCWNKIKMTSSKWIACCHRSSCCDSSRISNYDLKSPSNNNTTTTSFNTYSGRRNKCSPSISSSDNSTNAFNNANNQSPSYSFSSSTGFDWANHSQSSFSSSSTTTSANSIFFHQQQQSSTPKPKKLPPSNATPKYNDLSFPRHHRSKDDSMLASSSSTTQSIITLINPFEYLLINCETNDDTNCAQISPKQEIIAVSNEYWLAFYSIRDNNCLGTIQFPKKCLYWTWINGDTVAIITEDLVYHWCLSRPKSLDYVFSLDEDIRTNQIVDYNVDPLYGYWCAVTALSVNEDGEIGGKIQIFSQNHMQSQCIEAHSCMFVSYQFDGNENESNLLIAVNRERIDLWKLYIIDLSSTSANNFKNRPLKSQQLMMHAFSPRTQTINNSNQNESSSEQSSLTGNYSEMTSLPSQPPPFCDIPTHLECDDDLGLIFIISKYGSIYICDLETGTPLYYDSIQQYTDSTAIFSVSYDPNTTCLMAICRKGQVLVIKILLKQLLEQRIVQKLQTNIYDRINERIQLRKSSNSWRRNSSTPINNHGHGSHRRKSNTNKDYKTRTVCIMVNNDSCDQINETTKIDDNHSQCRSSDDSVIDLQQQDLSGSYPSYDYDDDDLEEQITRL